MATRTITIIDALTDAQLLGPFFPAATWRPWLLCAAAMFGLTYGLSPDDQAFILRCLGRTILPTSPASRAFLICGRRAGKSRFASAVAVFLATCRDYTSILAPGEQAVGMIVCPDRKQARIAFSYCAALIDAVPMLAAMVAHRTKDTIVLRTGISIECVTASYRTTRGYTVVFVVGDEFAYLPHDDSAEPDTELLTALEPAMATVPGALLLLVSTPYAKKGELWKAYAEHFGKDDADTFVWNADTRTMNATVNQAVIDRAFTEDAAAAIAEYGRDGRVAFRTDVETFVARDAIDACVVPNRFEVPPVPGTRYFTFLDFAGGSGTDAAALGIAHVETRGHRTIVVLDLVREIRPPFSPAAVCQDFATIIKAYRGGPAVADRYAGQFPVEQMRKYGLDVTPSESTKSDIYRDVLPLINSGAVELLDHPRLIAQLAGLERRTARGGKDSIDHGPGSHDDISNAAAGACTLAALAPRVTSATWGRRDPRPTIAAPPVPVDEPTDDEIMRALANYGDAEVERFTSGTMPRSEAVAIVRSRQRQRDERSTRH